MSKAGPGATTEVSCLDECFHRIRVAVDRSLPHFLAEGTVRLFWGRWTSLGTLSDAEVLFDRPGLIAKGKRFPRRVGRANLPGNLRKVCRSRDFLSGCHRSATAENQHPRHCCRNLQQEGPCRNLSGAKHVSAPQAPLGWPLTLLARLANRLLREGWSLSNPAVSVNPEFPCPGDCFGTSTVLGVWVIDGAVGREDRWHAARRFFWHHRLRDAILLRYGQHNRSGSAAVKEHLGKVVRRR